MMTFLFVAKPKLILELYSYSGDIKMNFMFVFQLLYIYLLQLYIYIKIDSLLRVRINDLPILLNNAETSHLEIAANCFSGLF